jgi:Zn-dependent protease with chaperone function
MFPLSPWRTLGAVLVLLAAMAGVDGFLVNLDSPEAARDLASTGVLAILVVAWPWWAPRMLPLLMGKRSRSVDPAHHARLAKLLSSLNLGRIAPPQLVVYENKALAAVTTGTRTQSLIAVSTGLLGALNDQQLRAAIAHELGHAEGGHMILTAGYLATLLLAKSLFGAMGLAITLVLLLTYLALLRRNEIDADRRAADRAGDDDVVDLLLTLKVRLKEPACLDWPGMSILSTHPGYRTRAARVRDRTLGTLV